jgi:prefoldin subunit 5
VDALRASMDWKDRQYGEMAQTVVKLKGREDKVGDETRKAQEALADKAQRCAQLEQQVARLSEQVSDRGWHAV